MVPIRLRCPGDPFIEKSVFIFPVIFLKICVYFPCDFFIDSPGKPLYSYLKIFPWFQDNQDDFFDVGNYLSEERGNSLVTGPTNQTIILNDRSNRKVFEIYYDATGSAVIVKGDNVHLKINSNGNIEKWTPLENDSKDQYPLIIQPVIPRPPLLSEPGPIFCS